MKPACKVPDGAVWLFGQSSNPESHVSAAWQILSPGPSRVKFGVLGWGFWVLNRVCCMPDACLGASGPCWGAHDELWRHACRLLSLPGNIELAASNC